jgi:hypothetical protein
VLQKLYTHFTAVYAHLESEKGAAERTFDQRES